jgi:hypothetical protein
MRIKLLTVWLIVCFAPCLCHGDSNYAKEVKKCVHSAIGSDFDKYQYLSAPIDNFGTGTMYPEAAKGEAFDIKTAGLYGDPGTWWTFSDPQRVASELAKLRPSGNGGGVAATCNTTTKFSLSAVLPALFKLLTVNASVNYNKAVNVQISFSSIEFRPINWSQLAADDRDKLINSDVSAHLGAHDFLITVGDVVLHQYTAQLTFNKTLDVNAKAQLTSAWKQFAKDSSLTADFSDSSTGSYTLTAKNPVVAAVFVGQPPAGVTLENAGKTVNQVNLSQKVLTDLVMTKPTDLTGK